tara:strand:- start:598 stop:1200 length:603 start_codon:yes stop_codon:yes gene_type:complete
MIYIAVGIFGILVGFVVSKTLHDKKIQQLFLERDAAAKTERSHFLKTTEERQIMLDSVISSMVEKNSLLKKEIYGVKNTIEKIDLRNSKKQKEKELAQSKEMKKYFAGFTKHVDVCYTPSLQELLELREGVKNIDNKIKKLIANDKTLKEEINSLRKSNEQKYFETRGIIQETKNDITRRLDKNNLLTRPPRHIICGTLP